MDNLKIGILGYANIAQKAIIPAILELPQLELVGIATRNKDNTQEIKDKYSCKLYDSYEAIIDSSIVDALYIPLPNSLHYQWVKMALNKGIHVLVEKSLALDVNDVEELNEIAKNNNCVLIENFQFRFHSQLQFIKNEISKGTIGELRGIRSSFGFPPFPDQNNIRYKKDLGGGALFDAGAYPIKLAQELMGFQLEIQSANLSYEGNEVDIWGGGTLAQKDRNLFMHFSFGFDNFYQCNFELWGSKGKMSSNRIFTAPPGYCPEVSIETQAGVSVIKLETDNHFLNMLKHFFLCIKDESLRNHEYLHNNIQARLLNEFKNKINDN